jgi:hypothetical protein
MKIMSSHCPFLGASIAPEISDQDSSLSWPDGVVNSSEKITHDGCGDHGVRI